LEVRFVGNEGETVGRVLESILADAEEARVAVAYARPSGLEELPAIEQFAKNAKPLRFLAGVDFQLTDLSLIERLHVPPSSESRVYWLQAAPDGKVRNFHPKVYVARKGREVQALVGSSNFTAGGLRKNAEANLLIQGSQDEPAVRQILEFHEQFWSSPFAVPVSAPLRQTYDRLQARRVEAEVALRRERHYDGARRSLDLAVAEALASYGEPRGSRTWLMVTSSDNYILCQRRRIWGDVRRSRIENIREGDILLFYLSGVHQLGMMAMVSGPVFEEREPYWPDRLYPYRLPFIPLAEPGISLPFRPMIAELDLFSTIDPRNWGQTLQRSQIELSSKDAQLIRRAILQASGLELSA
jgi:HKD family nuclease